MASIAIGAQARPRCISDQDHDHRRPVMDSEEAEFEEQEIYLSDSLEPLGEHQEYEVEGPVDIQEMVSIVLGVIDELDEECK